MRRVRIALLFSIAFSALSLAAQTNSAGDRTSLAIKLSADGPARAFPRSFTVTFINRTDHEIRFPKPTISCAGGLDGTLTVAYKLISNEPRLNKLFRGCICDYFEPPSALDRSKFWTPIAPGGSIRLQVTTEQIDLEFPDRGKYEFTATYTPPHFTKDEQTELKNAGISYPDERLVSQTITATKQ